MATITKKVCDRCGRPLEYINWTSILKNVLKKGKSIKIHNIYNGNPDGYIYIDERYELCAECTKKLEDFLRCKGDNQ